MIIPFFLHFSGVDQLVFCSILFADDQYCAGCGLLFDCHCFSEVGRPSNSPSLLPCCLPVCSSPCLCPLVLWCLYATQTLCWCNHWSSVLCVGHTYSDAPTSTLITEHTYWLLGCWSSPVSVPGQCPFSGRLCTTFTTKDHGKSRLKEDFLFLIAKFGEY